MRKRKRYWLNIARRSAAGADITLGNDRGNIKHRLRRVGADRMDAREGRCVNEEDLNEQRFHLSSVPSRSVLVYMTLLSLSVSHEKHDGRFTKISGLGLRRLELCPLIMPERCAAWRREDHIRSTHGKDIFYSSLSFHPQTSLVG